VSDYYSPEKNTLFLIQTSENLCYDRQTPNADFYLRERVAKALPNNPMICVINLFTLNSLEDKEAKIKYLTEQCEVPLVG
jgi:hypothetical protein